MFEWSDDELAVRDAVRQFVDNEIRPLQDDLEHGDLPPYDVIRKFYKSFGVGELAGEAFDASLEPGSGDGSEGGSPGLDPAMQVLVTIEMVKVSMGIPASIGVSAGLTAGTINSRGTVEQRKRWARDLLTFDKVGAWAITEPDSGSDAFGGMRTTVRPAPDNPDEFVLNGQKTFITNGPYADTIVVYAKLAEPPSNPATGSGPDLRDRPVLTFVLDTGMPGLTQGKPFKKMGMHSSPTGELFFDNVRLGRDRLLDAEQGTDGRSSARANFVAERVGIASLSLGVIEECQ